MLPDTLAQLEKRIAEAGVREEARQELLALVTQLKTETAELAKTHGDAAHSIAGFSQLSAHEATRATPNPTLTQHALDGLAASVRGFEQSHPQLVAVVNRFCSALADLGI